MTRGNLNFVYQERGSAPQTLYQYWNGDQYPSGLRDVYNVLAWLKEEKKLTKEGFIKWINKNYDNHMPIKITHPAIYYDAGNFIADYSYLFESNSVMVWNWGKLLFDGDLKGFIKWIKEQ